MLQGIDIKGLDDTTLADFVNSQFKSTCNHYSLYVHKGFDYNRHASSKDTYDSVRRRKSLRVDISIVVY